MGCCGQRRAALATQAMPTAPRAPFQPNARPAGFLANRVEPLATRSADTAARMASGTPAGMATVSLRYLAGSPLSLLGPVTARAYEFSPGQPVQPVAAADAMALLGSRLFRRA